MQFYKKKYMSDKGQYYSRYFTICRTETTGKLYFLIATENENVELKHLIFVFPQFSIGNDVVARKKTRYF